MAELTREALLCLIEDFEATLAEFQSNNVVLATPVLLQRLEELGRSPATRRVLLLCGMIQTRIGEVHMTDDCAQANE